MKKIKFILRFLGIFLILIGLVNCQHKRPGTSLRNWMKPNGKVKVLSTIAQIGDLVKEIGGERIDCWVLIQGFLDPHSYELVKGDDEKLGRANLIFYNGLGLEHSASLSQWLLGSKKSVGVADAIHSKHSEKILYRGAAPDPHIWMDISLWRHGVNPIVEALSQIDPEGRAEYEARGKALLQKMEIAHDSVKEIVHKIPADRRYLVTSHDAFHYFTRSYLAEKDEAEWEKRVAAPEGLSPDGQLSSVDLQIILAYLQKNQVRVLFPESNVSRASIYKIVSACKEMGMDVTVCNESLYGDAIDDELLDYFGMMNHNAQVILRYLGTTCLK